MKKYLLLSAGILAVSFLSAQKEVRNPDGSYYKKCARMVVSEPLWKIAKDHPIVKYDKPREAADAKGHKAAPSSFEKFNRNASIVDPVIQNTDGVLQSAATIVSVNGANGQGGYPLDPNGMIGSNYYVQTVNSSFMVFNKTGTSKLVETDLANLFGTFTCDDGDPVTIYDKFADRWVITEFQENDNPCFSSFSSLIDTMMMAVSVTNDPTGSYYVYYFCPDNTDYADYPKYSIWADGYYQTCNCQNDKVVVYQRDSMLKGSANAGLISIPYNYNPVTSSTCGAGGFYCPMMTYADGTLPPYGSPNYLIDYTDDNWGACWAGDSIRIFKVSVNWSSTTGSITPYQELATAPFNSYFTGGTRADIDAVGTAKYYDALDGFFSYRIPYSRWTTYNAAVMCHPVNVSPTAASGGTLAGIRWYELHQDLSTNLWSIYQQGTYAPNDGVNRWNPAIAMDQNGSIALSYSVSDITSTYPGIRYTGRKVCDTLGKMTLAEGTAVSGNVVANTSQGGGHRWGDYSHVSVDPADGITFWSTNMYASSSSPNSSQIMSRVFSFQIPKCPLGIANISAAQAEITAYQSGSQLNVKGVKLPANESIVVELFDVSGKRITGKSMNSFSGTVETSFNTTGLAKGVYFVRIGNDSFLRVVKVEIQ